MAYKMNGADIGKNKQAMMTPPVAMIPAKKGKVMAKKGKAKSKATAKKTMPSWIKPTSAVMRTPPAPMRGMSM